MPGKRLKQTEDTDAAILALGPPTVAVGPWLSNDAWEKSLQKSTMALSKIYPCTILFNLWCMVEGAVEYCNELF